MNKQSAQRQTKKASNPVRTARPRASQRGQGMVELAVTLPLVVLILVAIADLGRIFYADVTLTSAAQSGALYASSSAVAAVDTTGIRNAALADTSTLFGRTSSNPSVTSSVYAGLYGAPTVAVTTTFTFQPIFPYPLLPHSFTMARSASVRIRQ